MLPCDSNMQEEAADDEDELPADDVQQTLEQRMARLHDVVAPVVLENIEKAQETQKRHYDSRHTPQQVGLQLIVLLLKKTKSL